MIEKAGRFLLMGLDLAGDFFSFGGGVESEEAASEARFYDAFGGGKIDGGEIEEGLSLGNAMVAFSSGLDGDVEVEAVCPRGEAAEEVGDIGGGETEGGVGACTSGDESGLSGG